MLSDPLPLLQYLRVLTGRPPEFASPRQWLSALAALVRGRIAEQWGTAAGVRRPTGARHVYYLSMEFLPGRLLVQALHALGLYQGCHRTLADHGLDLDAIAELEADPALGNGGLGRLAACLLDSMANLGLAAHGYGIRYDCGLFAQQIEDGWQRERPDPWLCHGNPWEIPRTDLAYAVAFGGRVIDHGMNARPRYAWIDSDEVLATAYDMPVLGYESHRLNTLRLWSPRMAHELDLQSFNNGDHVGAFSRRNAIASLSLVLYPGDTALAGRELRFKQEYFFVSASIQDILRRFRRGGRPLDRLPDDIVIQINDTHPSLAIIELMRLLLDGHGLDWEHAWHLTRRSFAYTNHTLMPEALETWPLHFFERLLPRHLRIIYEINDWLLRDVRRRCPDDPALIRRMSLVDEDGDRRIRMAHLAIAGSHRINGVSKIHTRLMRQTTFGDFAALYPDKIINVTNGISFRRWLHEANPELVALIRSRIGDRWLRHSKELAALAPHADDPAFRAAFRTIKHRKKLGLADLVARDCGIPIDTGSLVDVQIKRIHEYKRQLLKLLHVVALYDRLRRGASRPSISRTVIFAGKAAPGYAIAKLIVKLIHDVATRVNIDPAVNECLRVVFIPDYGVGKAQTIIPAADLSEQISTAGHEASGTGNMKLALNGALTVGTLDGANIEIREAVGAENFFAFGATIDEAAELRATGYDPRRYYHEDAELKSVLDLIVSGHFSPSSPELFRPVAERLIGDDPYLVLADFASYMRCQEQIEADYRDAEAWSRRAILNIAGMGGFSSDNAVRHYAELIWKAGPHADESASADRAEAQVGVTAE